MVKKVLPEKLLQGFKIESPKPKIFQHEGKRYAVRLEPVFLRTLDILARENNMRTNAFVAGLNQAFDGKNFSSFLRSFCMAEAEKKLSGVDAMSHLQNLHFFMNHSPIPGLILSENQTILFANSAFFDWTGEHNLPTRERPFHELFEVRSKQSIRDLLNRILCGHQEEASLSVTYTGKNLRLGASAVFVPYTNDVDHADRIFFITWLKTVPTQRPPRLLRVQAT